MENQRARLETRRWLLQLAPAWIFGLILRLYQLPGQILVDDEWHALNFVLEKPLLHLFTRQGLGANCIPQNIYTYALLHTVGWSEMLLRLPSIVCGALSLIIFPFLIRKIWNARVATAFAYLLAIAPCVIFYSRLCRPYSMVLFFGMLSLLSMFIWMKEGKRSHQACCVIAAFAAVYLHLYAALFVLPPLACLFMLRILKDRGALEYPIQPSRGEILRAACVILVLISLFVLPANLAGHEWMNFLGVEKIRWRTFQALLDLWSGTHWPLLKISFTALAASGLYFILRDDFPIGIIIAACLSCFLAALLISRQHGMNVAIIPARYGIIAFPLLFLLAAVSLAKIADRLRPRGLAFAGIVSYAAVFFLCGPIPAIYGAPNNFTNHSAFQYSYEPTDWSRSRERGFMEGYVLKKSDISGIYPILASDQRTLGVIEYPMAIGDEFNVYYYYQRFHRKRVAGGYLPLAQTPSEASPEGNAYGNALVGYVINRIAMDLAGSIRFKNLVPLTDIGLLKTSFSRWNIIIHHDLASEAFPDRFRRNGQTAAGAKLLTRYLKTSGMAVVHEDDKITMLRVP